MRIKKLLRTLSACSLGCVCLLGLAGCSRQPEFRAPVYHEVRLGAIKPEGWLREMLERQRDGITANLDEIYPEVCGPDNGWLGGEGDRWERGPYWIDGLVPLAYILDDEALKAKAQAWIEWTLASQQEDGFFGPDKSYPYIEGLQRGMAHDWWPRIVALKFLQQYYNATGDERVIPFFDKYFRYQLATLPEKPLGNWTFWAEYRACDNLKVVLWLYEKTREPYLLELARLLHQQSFDFTGAFLGREMLSTLGSIHCVNLAQGLKEPVIYYQADPQPKYIDAVRQGLADIRRFNGIPTGMYGGDEALHGNNPSQGSELCASVEMMFSMEEMLKVTGDVFFADYLEKVAFNMLPSQITDDFKWHQYLQQANQVTCSFGVHNFDIGYQGTGQVFGLLTGYPCCTCNLHQGWPKFTQNLWYESEGGLAAMVYAPCTLTTTVGSTEVTIEEKTSYPMTEEITFLVNPSAPSTFELSFRIPLWCSDATLSVNGEAVSCEGPVAKVRREWTEGDVVVLYLPMKVTSQRWYQNAASVERGSLVFALGIGEKWEQRSLEGKMALEFGPTYFEVFPTTTWNYGLMKEVVYDSEAEVVVDEAKLAGDWWWSLGGAPVKLLVNASRIDDWTLYNGDAGQMPYSQVPSRGANDTSSHAAGKIEQITLVPYGCTTLRISEFPVLTH
ncbi:MAG: glycoside hydrolase family 127 protein [Bacteroidales bacterium]|nr:glycoside hydrolase family 127 protein [Bacteroidales bacterium]